MDPARLLDGLDPSQRRAVTSEAQQLAILAGAGSGKTRVLTRRIAHRCLTGAADARHVLAVTFTRRAAGELDERLRALGLRDLPAAGTFHALAYAQLRVRWASTGAAPPALLDRKGKVLGRILGRTTRVSPSDLATEIEWAKARRIDPSRYALAAAQADRRLPVDPNRIAEWYEAYELTKVRRGLVDFDDLLDRCASAIEDDPSFAAAQRWRFRHLFVDEYQDVNPLQDRLLRAWLGDRPDLTVVGDPNQAIYGWNGADPDLLVRFAHHHPGAEVVRLEHAYRSTPQILAVAASTLGRDAAASVPSAVRGPGPAPTIVGYPSDIDEASGLARAVHDHHVPGRPWSAQAVLVRTNAQATLVEAAFRRAAIPHRVRGARRFLDQPDVIDLLRRIDQLNEPLATTLADVEARIARDRDDALAEVADDVVPEGGGTGVAANVLHERTALGRRLDAWEQVVRLGHDLLVVDPHARTDALSPWLRATLQDDGPERADAVTIITFHAAKGLEWPVVHIAGMEAGYVPITHARTPQALAEEQRLLYVAITRGADVVRFSWAATRTFGTQTVERRPSPHLPAIRAVTGALQAEARPVAAPISAIASTRAQLARSVAPAGTAADDPLRGSLLAWRHQIAHQASVRPTVVLDDRAIEAIVRSRPGDLAELAGAAELGPLTLDRYGARLLALVAEHPPVA